MNTPILPNAEITLEQLVHYLKNTQWQDVTLLESRGRRFAHGLYKDIDILLPRSNDFLDTRERIRDALNVLSQLEKKKLNEVIEDVIGLNQDSVQFRLHIPTDADSLPLASVPDMIYGIRNLWLYGACSEGRPERHYEHPTSEATAFLESCKFGHTFRGSFGFVVATEIVRPSVAQNLFIPPLGRRVTERMARGLHLLTDAVSSDDSSKLVQSYESAFNARMCDALVDVALRGEAVVSCGIEWARTISVAPDLVDFTYVTIGQAEVDVLKDVAQKLKRIEPTTEHVTGYVVNLHCLRDPKADESYRTIEIRSRHPQYGSIEVRMVLDAARYITAVEAHTVGKQVMVSGLLSRTGNAWSMTDISALEPIGIA